ncbi:MAG: class I SAM-dependent methyltransferase [Verrucomicrobiia bacterium]
MRENMQSSTANADSLETIACGVCGCETSRHLFLARDYIYGNSGEWPVSQCAGCGVVFMNPRIPPRQIGAYYPPTYYTNERGQNPIARATWKRGLRDAFLRQYLGYSLGPTPKLPLRMLVVLAAPLVSRFDSVQRYVGYVKDGRVLDVGCGNGHMLSSYRALGWETWGCEVSAASAQLAAIDGHQIFVGEVTAARYPSNHFDAVTMWDALEHVHNPGETLVEIRRVLKPGGYLHVSVPNAGSLYWRVFLDKWFMFTCPLHYYHYTAATLREAFMRANLIPVKLLSTAGHAGLRQTLNTATSQQAWIHSLLASSVAQRLLRWADVFMPWGHLVCVGRKAGI